MLKLCIITTIPITVKAFWAGQIEFLQQAGFEVTVITSPDKAFAQWLPKGVTYKPILMTRTINPLSDLKAFFAIYRYFKITKFDLIQYATPKAALLGSIAGWAAGIPVRLYLMWGLYYVTQSGLKRKLFKHIEQLACRFSTAIAPDSKGNVQLAVEERLCKSEKIAVVGHGSANGVDTSRFDPDQLAPSGKKIRSELNFPLEAKVLGCIAVFTRDKGIVELIGAFEILARTYPNLYLLLIGKSAEKDQLDSRTLDIIKTHPRIKTFSFVPELEKYMAAMDIFVLPTYREGFGVVNVEACAMQLPVITTDVPGPQEAIVHETTGLLVPAKTVEPLVAAISRLLENPDFARQLGIAGRKRVQELYEQKKLWQTIVDHRSSLLNKSRATGIYPTGATE